MAGTIFGLGLSQRVDLNAEPSVGWLLYLYEANSSTPVDSYQDTALTVLNPWPIAADANGMMPQFWLADGSYRARATNADASITYFDIPSAQALGPSVGSAPSGGVDPTAIFQTGDLIWVDYQGTRSGWVRDNGRTIGSSTSGATERANADCQALFEYLWNNFSNTICPVAGGRGGSASADWSANKQITLPDKRGCVPGGLDDMGNSAKSSWGSVPKVLGSDAVTGGNILGENLHTLNTAEMPSHSHAATVTDPAHNHGPLSNSDFLGDKSGGSKTFGTGAGQMNGDATTANATTNITVSNASTGGGDAHNNAQLTVLGTFYRKL